VAHDDKSQEKEPFLLSMLPFAGLALLLLLGLVWRYLPKDAPPPPPEPPAPTAEERAAVLLANFNQMPQRQIEISPEDFSLGPADAPVTVVEFSDFECPSCRMGASTATEILAKHPEDVRLVFRTFHRHRLHKELQQQLHPFACRAAVIARCAEIEPRSLLAGHDTFFGASRSRKSSSRAYLRASSTRAPSSGASPLPSRFRK
jgi:hypothetical protein